MGNIFLYLGAFSTVIFLACLAIVILGIVKKIPPKKIVIIVMITTLLIIIACFVLKLKIGTEGADTPAITEEQEDGEPEEEDKATEEDKDKDKDKDKDEEAVPEEAVELTAEQIITMKLDERELGLDKREQELDIREKELDKRELGGIGATVSLNYEIEVSASQIISGYLAGRENGDSLYGETPAKINGVISEINQDVLGGYYIIFGTPSAYNGVNIQCYFASGDPEIAKLENLRVGNSISIAGTIDELVVYSVLVTDCVIV